MLINLRDKEEKLSSRDVLDIEFDMSIYSENKKYYIRINSNYTLAERFDSLVEAEDRMLDIAEDRNALENELRQYW